MWHPWRTIRDLAHISVRFEDQPVGRIAATNGTDTIWMDTRLLQVQRRVAATHELIHIERGHTSGCTPTVERSVNTEVARRLITIDALIDALRWTENWEEASEVLWVTVEILQARIDHLTPHETALLMAAAKAHDRPA